MIYVNIASLSKLYYTQRKPFGFLQKAKALFIWIMFIFFKCTDVFFEWHTIWHHPFLSRKYYAEWKNHEEPAALTSLMMSIWFFHKHLLLVMVVYTRHSRTFSQHTFSLIALLSIWFTYTIHKYNKNRTCVSNVPTFQRIIMK